MGDINLEKEVLFLLGEVGTLRESLELLSRNCSCSIPERMSGHLVDCAIPHVRELLDGDAGIEPRDE